MMRCGCLARKVGMTRMFDADGRHVPVTVLATENCQVVQHKTVEKDGYQALQLGMGVRRKSRTNKAMSGHFTKTAGGKVQPKQMLQEFRTTEDALEIGTEMKPERFEEGQFVDVCGTTIGKGFAGAMKRHNFGGLRASHGVSISHRAHGSTGQCQDPGRVFKGKKMAGHMGNVRRTVQNLKVVGLDAQKGLILVKGAVPGSKGSVVRVTDAVKKQRAS